MLFFVLTIIMETKESEKVVIAKPIASKPGFSDSKSLTDHLSNPINDSPLNSSVIRPKTMRFRPALGNVIAGVSNSESKVSESDAVSKVHVVYKPIAKLVSMRTVTLLENPRTAEVAASDIHPLNQTEPTSDLHRICDTEPERTKDSLPETIEDSRRLTSVPPPHNNDERPYDTTSWRKYGQKQVKGSEHPRSYYKCTYPNCPVKKKVEKTSDGQIAEIVYRGEHNHSKVVHEQARGLACEATRQEDNLSRTDQICVESPTLSTSSGLNREGHEVNESAVEAGSNGFRAKRRKCENETMKTSTGEEGSSSEPRFVVRKNTDSDKIGDGYRWRKYGQKVVKGNSYPRSYYRCTSPMCNVRKYVERTSEDPGSFITTYEGRHSHDMPSQSTRKS